MATQEELDAKFARELGVPIPTPDLTQEPALPDQGALERILGAFSGLEQQSMGRPRTFGEGLIGGLGRGLGAAGTKAQAARQKLEEGARLRQQRREAGNIEATKAFREAGYKALLEKRKPSDVAKTVPLTADLLKMHPEFKRVPLGTNIPVEWFKPQEAKPKDNEPIVAIEGPNGPVYVNRSDAIGKSPPKAAAKPATAVQQQATAFYNRAKEAVNDAISGGLENRIARLGTYGQYGMKAPNVLQSPDLQKYNNAKRAFAIALLRKESGAAISAGEYDSIDKTYFVQPGDSQSTVIQKKRARTEALKGLKLSAAPSAAPAPEDDAEYQAYLRASGGP